MWRANLGQISLLGGFRFNIIIFFFLFKTINCTYLQKQMNKKFFLEKKNSFDFWFIIPLTYGSHGSIQVTFRFGEPRWCYFFCIICHVKLDKPFEIEESEVESVSEHDEEATLSKITFHIMILLPIIWLIIWWCIIIILLFISDFRLHIFN